jgi:hypothetical protein
MQCECGCGADSNGQFVPGHDQELRALLEQQVGGLLQLRALAGSARLYSDGTINDEKFTQTVRAVFAAVRRGTSQAGEVRCLVRA